MTKIIAEKHLIALMHTSLLNTAALWYCLCCSDIVLFVDLFSFICFLSFDFVRVCLEQCYIWKWMACLDGLGWHFFYDCIGSLVSAHGGAPVYVTHAIATPMHVRVRNGLPFHVCCLISNFFDKLKWKDIFLHLSIYSTCADVMGLFFFFFL